MGVWARKQMEARTPIGVEMVELFYQPEKATKGRRRVRVAKDLAASKGTVITPRTVEAPKFLSGRLAS
jgi:hypothetical protein